MPATIATPLSQDEFETLADFLDAHSPFDTDGLLGLLHAVAIAPGQVLPSAWIRVLVPQGFVDQKSEETGLEFIGLVMRQYNEVVDALQHRQTILPDPDDVQGCTSFAAGYVAGAELDAEWIGNDDRWTFAAPLAYLGGKHDLVPPKMLDDIERHLQPDPNQSLRQQLAAMVATAYDSFEKYRCASASGPPPPPSTRIGRNDPCSCGSGKKYKRCCINRQPATGAR